MVNYDHKNEVSKIGSFFDRYENFLFNIKFFIIIAVVMAAILAIVLLGIGSYETFLNIKELLENKLSVDEFYINVLSISDIFLFSMVMIIFSLGSYNLFISRLDNIPKDSIHNDKVMPDWLNVKDFGELKELFIKVIVLILAILFLEKLISLNSFDDLKKITGLLIFPISILLISISLKLMVQNNKE